jgi:hypothetical protein
MGLSVSDPGTQTIVQRNPEKRAFQSTAQNSLLGILAVEALVECIGDLASTETADHTTRIAGHPTGTPSRRSVFIFSML